MSRPRVATVLASFRSDVGGAALLLAATIVALVWANLPVQVGYADFWATELHIRIGGGTLEMNLHEFVNQGLMTFFFFVVGLEVKRDLVLGELADRRRIAVPLVAAVAGMAVPAAIFVAVTWGTDAQHGWGTVISTDTAFLLGILALLGRACPPQLRVLLMALAVADDVGALSVIAVFYTSELHFGYLAAAVAGVGLMFVLRWMKVWRSPAYLVLGVASWVMLYLSGVEPTLLGVAVAFATETYATRRDHVADAARRTHAYLQSPSPEFARSAEISLQRAVPVNERMLRAWQPWTTVVIVPLFALANAGIPLSWGEITRAFQTPVALGIVAGLVVGKTVGIFFGAKLAVWLRWGRLAPGLSSLHLLGGAALAGMGFTISLFIVDLAFADEGTANAARIGILAASVIAAVAGTLLLRYATHRHPPEAEPTALEPPVDLTHDHIRGARDAPITLVEYGDYETPESQGAYWAVQEVQRRLAGQVRFVFRQLVAADASPNARLAAEAAEVAGAQGRFWEMHDALYDTSSDIANEHLDIVNLLAKAAAIGLDQATFATDLGGGHFIRRVQQDAASALLSGAHRSPTFFIDGIRYEGATDAESLIAALTGTMAVAAPVPDGTDPRSERSDVLPPWRGTRGIERGPALPADLPDDVPETPDHDGILPRLADGDLRVLADEGRLETTHPGQVLFDVGDAVDDLLVVLSGAVAIVEYGRSVTPEISVHERGRFLGEVDLVTHQVSSRAAVVVRPGQLLRLTPLQQRAAFRRDPQLRETIARTALLRRAGLLEVPDLRVVGVPESAACRTLLDWAAEHERTISVEDASALMGNLDTLGVRPGDLPLVFTRSGELLKNPGPEELERAFPPRPRRSD